MNEQYAYAVARIRVKELSLFNRQVIERLMSCGSYEECLRVLAEKGWGDGTPGLEAERILELEREKTWALLRELVGDLSVFRAFLYRSDFQNLKAAIKAVVTDAPEDLLQSLFPVQGMVDAQLMLRAVRENDFALLPAFLGEPGKEAYLALLHTRDGQLCDIILDKAALCATLLAGQESGDEMITQYAQLTVATADIKIAVRGQRTGKSAAFLRRALAPCPTLDVERLAQAAQKEETLFQYLETTPYTGAAKAIARSASAFEKWCDDEMMSLIAGQKSNPFTVAPLAAYLLARENEIKTVRMILSGKRNHLDGDAIRARLRDMYV